MSAQQQGLGLIGENGRCIYCGEQFHDPRVIRHRCQKAPLSSKQIFGDCPICHAAVTFHQDPNGECSGCHHLTCLGCGVWFDLSAKVDPENALETLDALQAAIASEWNRLRTAPETGECNACPEFVRMQHDIASLLGVDADTDSIDLHDRIYGELSRRAVKAGARLPCGHDPGGADCIAECASYSFPKEANDTPERYEPGWIDPRSLSREDLTKMARESGLKVDAPAPPGYWRCHCGEAHSNENKRCPGEPHAEKTSAEPAPSKYLLLRSLGSEPGATELIDEWQQRAIAQGVFVRREGNTVYINGPIHWPPPPRGGDV